MPARIAYVLGGRVKPELLEAVAARRHPRFEYNVFVERNDATIVDYDALDASTAPFARWTVRKRLPLFGLPSVALARHAEFDAMLATGEDVGWPLAVMAYARRIRLPLYIVTHGSFFGSNKFALLMGALRRMRNVHFLCLSGSIARTMRDRFRVPAERVHATGYGVDTQFFEPREAEESAPMVVSAGAANRDCETLVKAVAPLGVKTRIAASSAWFPGLANHYNGYSQANVEVASAGDYCGLRDLYTAASCVVVPLHPAKHACGYAVVGEGMAMGKAVICSRTAAPSDFIVEGETGFYVEPGNVEQMRERIAYLLAHPEVARQMGEAARERMVGMYSVEGYCARMEQAMGLVSQTVGEHR